MLNLECPKCHTKLTKKVNYCLACGARISGNTGEVNNLTYNPLFSVSKEINNQENNLEDNSVDDINSDNINSNVSANNTQGLSDQTTVLGASQVPTTVLGSEQLDEKTYPYLIWMKNNEKILIDKPIFSIGALQNDYVINGNSAVSREHAKIITKDRRYYVFDEKSTNRTFVDERVVAYKEEVEIFSGTKLTFANEDFMFFVE